MSRSRSPPTSLRIGKRNWPKPASPSKAAPNGRAAARAFISAIPTAICSNWRRRDCGRGIRAWVSPLADFAEFVQRAQIVRPRLIFEGLRPVRPRYFADIEVAAAVYSKSVRRQELGWTETRAEPAEPGNALAGMVDDRHPRPKVRHVAADRLHGTEFADVANRAFAGRHEQAARAMQVVPLGLVLAVAVEHLHAMILAIGHIDPAIGIAGDVARDVELARIGAGPAPRQQQFAVRRVFVHARIAITVGHVDVALRRHGGMGAAMERLAAHVRRRLAGDTQGQQDLSLQGALADRMVTVVGQPDRIVGRHEDAVRAGKQPFAE